MVTSRAIKTFWQDSSGVSLVEALLTFPIVMLASPPLVISHAEVDEMARITRLALDLAWKELKS